MKPQRLLLLLIIGSILLFSAATSAAERPDVVVKTHNGRPTVFIDGVPNALPCYNTFGKRAFLEDMPQFYRYNMGLYFISPVREFWVGDTIDSSPLTEDTEAIYTLDEQARHIIEGDPGAYIFVRFTPRAPRSWYDLHPNEYFITDDGTISYVPTPSLASDLFWDRMAEASSAIIRYCESRPWANRVIGYANFHVTEGTHAPVHQSWLFDHNPLMTGKYRVFLKKKYGSDAALREAYGDDSLRIAAMEIPYDKLKGPMDDLSELTYWQNARDNRALRDYLELQRDLWHERFRHVGTAMEGAVNRNVIFLHDCLKQTMQGWSNWGFFQYGDVRYNYSWRLAYPETMSASGHMGVAPLFDTEGFDGLITPHDYQARGIGGVYEPEGIVDSIVLRGKYFMSEMDTRSYLTGDNGIGMAADDREWAAITWRNLATSFTRGFLSYWMEFGGGWLHSDGIQEIVARQVEVIKESVDWKHETVPGIAVILDDTAPLETNGSGNFLNEAVMWEWKMGLARCGVPHNIYLFEDLTLDNFPKHRVYYFPDLFKVDENKLAILREKVFRDGNLVVWGPGSGISDGETIGIESAERLTGFSFEMMPVNSPRRVHIANFGHPLSRGLDEATIFGSPLSYGPILIPKDGDVLGMGWTKGRHRHIGMAVREFGKGAARIPSGISSRGEGDYAAVFTTAVPLPADLWRNFAEYAGAHVYCRSNDVLVADTSVIALHSIYTGKKTIMLPRTYRVRDIISGKMIARNTKEITFELTAPDTRLFLLEKP